tara:strand:- start:158 stop:328 length:171 start_codon:yes stop_codon:yes gene_type:complete
MALVDFLRVAAAVVLTLVAQAVLEDKVEAQQAVMTEVMGLMELSIQEEVVVVPQKH